MSRSVNRVELLGNVGSDPEFRTVGNGTPLAKVSLATNRRWKNREGERSERTEWHRLTFWGKLAEIVAKYVHKGERLYVEGRIEYSQSTDDQGVTRYWTDVIVHDMVMLGSSRGEGESHGSGQAGERRTPLDGPMPDHGHGSPFDPDDNLPF